MNNIQNNENLQSGEEHAPWTIFEDESDFTRRRNPFDSEENPPLKFQGDDKFVNWLKLAGADVKRRPYGSEIHPGLFEERKPTIEAAVREFVATCPDGEGGRQEIAFAILGWYRWRLLAYLLIDGEPLDFIEPDTFMYNPSDIDTKVGPLDMWWTNLLDWSVEGRMGQIHSWKEESLPWADAPEEIQRVSRRFYGIKSSRTWRANTELFENAEDLASYLNQNRGVEAVFDVYPALNYTGVVEVPQYERLKRANMYWRAKEELRSEPSELIVDAPRFLNFGYYRGQGFQRIGHNRTLETEMHLRVEMGRLTENFAWYVMRLKDLRPYLGVANEPFKGDYYVINPRGAELALLVPARCALVEIGVEPDFDEISVKTIDVCFEAAHERLLRRFEDRWLPFRSPDVVIPPEDIELEAIRTVESLDAMREKEIPSRVQLWQYHNAERWFSGLGDCKKASLIVAQDDDEEN